LVAAGFVVGLAAGLLDGFFVGVAEGVAVGFLVAGAEVAGHDVEGFVVAGFVLAARLVGAAVAGAVLGAVLVGAAEDGSGSVVPGVTGAVVFVAGASARSWSDASSEPAPHADRARIAVAATARDMRVFFM